MSGKWEKGGVDAKALVDLMQQLKDLHAVVSAQRDQEIDKAVGLGENIEVLVDYNQVSREAAEKVRAAAEQLKKAKANFKNG